MSTTRQSAHICRRCKATPPVNIECAASLALMLSIICRVPKGLAQRMQLNGVASLSTIGFFAVSARFRRGTRVIASSGQVATHRRHCTQLRSMKRNCGDSWLSARAAAGHAPTHDRHRVHLALSIASAP